MTWWNNAKIKSYSDAVALWETCRNPAKGKPITPNVRMFKNGDGSFSLRYLVDVAGYGSGLHGLVIATIHSNNIVELQDSNHTPTGIYKTIPVMLNRIGQDRYRVAHVSTLPTTDNGTLFSWAYLRKEAPEFFDHITFDLATGECLNRKPDLKYRVNPDVSLQWKRAVREYDKGWRLRVRLDLIPRDELSYPVYKNTTELAIALATAIKEQDFSESILSTIRVMAGPDLEAFKYVVDLRRTTLRLAFGVFTE